MELFNYKYKSLFAIKLSIIFLFMGLQCIAVVMLLFQITDYGMPSFLAGQDNEESEHLQYRSEYYSNIKIYRKTINIEKYSKLSYKLLKILIVSLFYRKVVDCSRNFKNELCT